MYILNCIDNKYLGVIILYSEIVMDHFKNPRNVGIIENADGIGEEGDAKCGDYLKITIQVDEDMIKDIKFQVHGCVGAIASSSMTTELAKGKSIMDAFALTEYDIVNALGGLPPQKIHCSLLGAIALKKAISDYDQKRNKKGN